MKIRVSYVVEVDNEVRRAINFYYGFSGLASRLECQRWLEQYGSAAFDDIVSNLRNHQLEHAE